MRRYEPEQLTLIVLPPTRGEDRPETSIHPDAPHRYKDQWDTLAGPWQDHPDYTPVRPGPDATTQDIWTYQTLCHAQKLARMRPDRVVNPALPVSIDETGIRQLDKATSAIRKWQSWGWMTADHLASRIRQLVRDILYPPTAPFRFPNKEVAAAVIRWIWDPRYTHEPADEQSPAEKQRRREITAELDAAGL